MSVILQDENVGNVVDDLQEIIDLAGHAEKVQENVQRDVLRIRIKAERILTNLFSNAQLKSITGGSR